MSLSIEPRLEPGLQPSPLPTVVSLTRCCATETGPEEPLERLTEIMRETAALAEREGGLIGHVKAWLAPGGGGGGVALSLVRREVRIRKLPPASAEPAAATRISLTAIIYGLEEKTLAEFLERKMERAFPA
ncbi:hypothetical protein FACS189460_3580 [Deltaproteobacteria bacterium]|nr:hypothetical protein FACS189460_3580 [Deltaproteobacteria bacterium]